MEGALGKGEKSEQRSFVRARSTVRNQVEVGNQKILGWEDLVPLAFSSTNDECVRKKW